MVVLRNVWRVTLAVSVVLVLVTVYLALFFAPLPATGVRSADTILPTILGNEITVSGFVTGYHVHPANVIDAPVTGTFYLADFSDYQRYRIATAVDPNATDWWTVQPIEVETLIQPGYGHFPAPTTVEGAFSNGANVSVSGTVRGDGTGLVLLYASDIKVGQPGEFSVMTAPVAQKIFYFHMPSAWASYLAFGVALLASILYLRTRNQKYDHWAHSSVEIGVVFATIAILTGPVWAKQEWGVYWRWDDTKLVTTFILWLVYIGYLSLRAAIQEPTSRSRVSAVYGILGFITVPMSFLSARIAPLLSSSHPEVIASSTGSLSPEAGMTVGIAVVAFTFLFITMLIKRVEISESEEEIEELKRKIGDE